MIFDTGERLLYYEASEFLLRVFWETWVKRTQMARPEASLVSILLIQVLPKQFEMSNHMRDGISDLGIAAIVFS